MKVYQLERLKGHDWDTHNGGIVVAKSSKQARALMDKKAGENGDWLSPKMTSCKMLKAEGKGRIVLTDFWSAG